MENEVGEQKVYYSVNDVLKMLGICRPTLYKEINAGKLELRKVRSRTIILKDALDRYVESLDTKVIGNGHK